MPLSYSLIYLSFNISNFLSAVLDTCAFEAVAQSFLEVHSTKVKPQTVHILKVVLEKFVIPIIGHMPVQSLKAPDFLDVLRRMEAHGHLYTAKRADIACSLVMRFAVASGLADINFENCEWRYTTPKTNKPYHYCPVISQTASVV